jgi:hypothetical protein
MSHSFGATSLVNSSILNRNYFGGLKGKFIIKHEYSVIYVFMMTTKICNGCNTEKNLSEFYFQNCKRVGHKVISSQCKLCIKSKAKIYAINNKSKRRTNERNTAKRFHIFIHNYYKTHPCVDCGNTDPRVLQFDHVRGEKIRAVSTMRDFSLKKVEEEIAKCEIRCANCHSIKTANEQGWYKDLDFIATENNTTQFSKHNYNAKLTESDVRIIRSSLLKNVELAKQFGVTPQTISRIRLKQIWKHVI